MTTRAALRLGGLALMVLPSLLVGLAAERAKVLEKESAELEKEAQRLAGDSSARIG